MYCILTSMQNIQKQIPHIFFTDRFNSYFFKCKDFSVVYKTCGNHFIVMAISHFFA